MNGRLIDTDGVYPGLGYLLLENDKEIVLIRESPEPPDYQSKYPGLPVQVLRTPSPSTPDSQFYYTGLIVQVLRTHSFST